MSEDKNKQQDKKPAPIPPGMEDTGDFAPDVPEIPEPADSKQDGDPDNGGS